MTTAMLGQQHTTQQAQAIPNAPAPQSLADLLSNVAPGKGTTPESDGSTQAAPAPAPVQQPKDTTPPPYVPPAGEGPQFTLRVPVNFVEIPVLVKDKNGALVPGLQPRDFRVYENGVRQHLTFFTSDPFPLSVAIVIDQSLPQDTMQKVNDALSALQGAFTPYDELSIFTYNNGPRQRTEFTGAQSKRITAVLQQSKSEGNEMGIPITSGPLAQGIVVNNKPFDPNTTPNRSGSLTLTVPKQVHTLNDAILAAAQATATRGKGRRRVVYVISDGKEAGSQASYKEVVKYLQTNKIAVYGTLVGDSATFGLGFLDKIHLPLLAPDNILPKYANATGGQLDAEFSRNGIERSFARIAEQVRNQYTLGYISHESLLDERFRKIEVQVMRPGLQVFAKDGYYPSASDAR
ncbi:MAG: VWA domain-containing protein [Acidobacteriaceae bacterium]